MRSAYKSNGAPIRSNGVLERIRSVAFSSLKTGAVISLGENSDAMVFAFILQGTHFTAKALVRFTAAPLDA